MVGHSGDMQATIKAVECLDSQLALLFDQIITIMNGTLIITADHGNAEDKFDITNNQPRTSHTSNPVPFLVVNNSLKGAKDQLTLKSLADIAPYILKIMQLPIPKEMSRAD
jgi:2,3-bisphosphoglycerate-independent phosphoglycerate mutase